MKENKKERKKGQQSLSTIEAYVDSCPTLHASATTARKYWSVRDPLDRLAKPIYVSLVSIYLLRGKLARSGER